MWRSEEILDLFILHTPEVTRRGFFTREATLIGVIPDDPAPLQEAIQFVCNLQSLKQ